MACSMRVRAEPRSPRVRSRYPRLPSANAVCDRSSLRCDRRSALLERHAGVLAEAGERDTPCDGELRLDEGIADGLGESRAGPVQFERLNEFALLHPRPGQYLKAHGRQSIVVLGFGDLKRLLSVSDSGAIVR